MDPEPGEQVFFHGHPSWWAFASFYLKGLLIAVVAGAGVGFVSGVASGRVKSGWVLVTVLAAFVAVLLIGLIKRHQTTYTITDQRLTVDRGLLARKLQETRLERVQNVYSRQTMVQRMLDVGTVDFDTAGGSDYDFSFHGVAGPRQIVRTVDRALRELRRAGPAV